MRFANPKIFASATASIVAMSALAAMGPLLAREPDSERLTAAPEQPADRYSGFNIFEWPDIYQYSR